MNRLHLYNTKSREIETFSPQNPPTVTMYACGPTVYDKTHIGHMRKYFGDDVLRRTLELLGFDVKHVMNITDVGHLTDDQDAGEDKLEKGAKEQGRTVWEIAEFYTDYFRETMHAINVLPPALEPKATDHVQQMIALTEKLMERGYAYETEQAVYFDTSKDEDYGKLSGQKLNEKMIGVRDEVVEDKQKRNPAPPTPETPKAATKKTVVISSAAPAVATLAPAPQKKKQPVVAASAPALIIGMSPPPHAVICFSVSAKADP